MPELPDVEVFRQYFSSTALHQKIRQVSVESPGVLANTNPRALGRALKQQSFEAADRHGKYLFAELRNHGFLVFHFGMTGKLSYFQGQSDIPRHTRCLISFDNGFNLAYVLPRKLGRIALAQSSGEFIREHELGPDAAALDLINFRKLASRRGGSIKAWLMDQSVMAGIGNVYSDEILFQAGLHPNCKLKDLAKKDIDRVHQAMGKVFRSAIKAKANPNQMPDSFLLRQRRKGGYCPRCGGNVQNIKAAGRSAWVCPKCQTCPPNHS